MYLEKKISVVLPAHNEAENIQSVILNIPLFVDFIVIVDDGSSDDTQKIVKAIRRENIYLFQHSQQRGVGYAVMSGYRVSQLLGADVVATMDSDGQMDPQYLRDVIHPVAIGQHHYVKGNRLQALNAFRRMPLPRWIGNIIFSVLTMVASGYWGIWDSQSGYTALSREILKKLPLNDIYGRYGFYNDLMIHLGLIGASIRNVPVDTHYGNEKSGLDPYRDPFRILKVLTFGFFKRFY